jgi:hypothetical protein
LPFDWRFAVHEAFGNFSNFKAGSWTAHLADCGHLSDFEQMSNYIITAALIDCTDSDVNSPDLQEFLLSDPQGLRELHRQVGELFWSLKSEPAFSQLETEGSLKQIQKTVLWALVSGLLQPSEIHRIEFSNEASRVVLAQWDGQVVINCEVNQGKDSGAMTINQIAPWIGTRRTNFTSFVTPRFCTASESFALTDFPDDTILNQKLSDFIKLFKSVGLMRISVEVERDSAWTVFLDYIRKFEFALNLDVSYQRSDLP